MKGGSSVPARRYQHPGR